MPSSEEELTRAMSELPRAKPNALSDSTLPSEEEDFLNKEDYGKVGEGLAGGGGDLERNGFLLGDRREKPTFYI